MAWTVSNKTVWMCLLGMGFCRQTLVRITHRACCILRLFHHRKGIRDQGMRLSEIAPNFKFQRANQQYSKRIGVKASYLSLRAAPI